MSDRDVRRGFRAMISHGLSSLDDGSVLNLRNLCNRTLLSEPDRREGWKVGELRSFLADLPDDGEVWIETGPGASNPCREVTRLCTKDVLIGPPGPEVDR